MMKRTFIVVSTSLALGLLLFGFFIEGPWSLGYSWIFDWGTSFLASRIRDYLGQPVFLAALMLTLILERIIPADKQQTVFSRSFFQDFVWFLYEPILHTLILLVFVSWMRDVYAAHFSYLTVRQIAEWPNWARFVFGALSLDFFYWLQHYVMHKVPWLWQLHTVHHSQKHLNFFSDYRYHILEYIVRDIIVVIPFLILEVNPPTIVLYSIILRTYTRFYHGNLRTNLGLPKYLMVTPQSHRIHHSKLDEHRDKNFGSVFAIWDHLFRTQYYGFDEYPETGIQDEKFPNESDGTLAKLLIMPLLHMLYPLKVIRRSITRGKA